MTERQTAVFQVLVRDFLVRHGNDHLDKPLTDAEWNAVWDELEDGG